MDFKYEIMGNDVVLVIDLFGDMDSKAVAIIEKCRDEILAQQPVKYVIFNFSKVAQVGGDAIQSWAQLQKSVRSKPAELRLCGIEEEPREKMFKYGILRTGEIAASLREAVASITMGSRNSTARKAA